MLANLKRVVAGSVLSISCVMFISYAILSKMTRSAREPMPYVDLCGQGDNIPTAIPKIVHQSWKTQNLTPIFTNFSATWKKCFPTWRYFLWTDEDNRRLMQQHFPWFIQRYDSLKDNIMRADVSRYVYMYVYGGIYADLDTECIKPFAHLLRNYSVVMGAMEGKAILPEGHTQNSFIYSIPRHPFWIRLLKYVFLHSNTGRPESITGPNALMECIRDHRLSCKGEIKIYGPRYFNPFSWVKGSKSCKSRLKMTPAMLTECRKKYANAYVLQYHAHTWEA